MPSRLRVVLDFLSDWAVLCFASWTIFAYIGMATQAKVSLLVALWLITVPVLAWVLRLSALRKRKISSVMASMRRRPTPV